LVLNDFGFNAKKACISGILDFLENAEIHNA
jgi:hypothetical protein